ncbi:MAG: CPBP family intramembrane glutamic endopeptidase [Hyphomicrobiaceae bacterium]|jgi:membrane protease YdiL (CAAX protease family)
MAELAILFLGAPAAMAYAIFAFRVPLFLVLQPVLIGLVAFMLWDRTFSLKRELARGFGFGEATSILAIFAAVAALVTWATLELFPHLFLTFPRQRQQLWQFVMVAYPVLSVLAQELVYRTFFFHRYGALFGTRRWLAIIVNGALFGFAHILFGNWIAVVGTALLGALLAWRYTRTRSFWAVWIEHTLYGWLVFTVGLGGFFFTGIASVR